MTNIRRFLDLSTAHLDDAAKAWLEMEADDASAYEGRHGFFVHCKEDPDNPGQLWPDTDAPRPESLDRIFLYAIGQGCDYVLFDCDAQVDEALPTFEEASA